MPRKRSHSSTSPSDGAASSDQGPSKHTRASSASLSVDAQEISVDQYPLKVYIISAKLSHDVLQNLVSLVEKDIAKQGDGTGAQHLELTTDVDQANVVVTAVHTRPRLERHVHWDVAVRGPSHFAHTTLTRLPRKRKPSSPQIG